MRRKTHVTRQDIPICRPHSTLTGGRSTRIRVWRGPSPRQRPPKTLSTQRPPPHSRFGRYSRTDLPSDHSNPPHRRTRQACLDRRAKPCFEPGRPLPQHPRVTHHTHAPSPCSHLARHPPHRVLRLCTTPPLLRSSTSLRHPRPRRVCYSLAPRSCLSGPLAHYRATHIKQSPRPLLSAARTHTVLLL